MKNVCACDSKWSFHTIFRVNATGNHLLALHGKRLSCVPSSANHTLLTGYHASTVTPPSPSPCPLRGRRRRRMGRSCTAPCFSTSSAAPPTGPRRRPGGPWLPTGQWASCSRAGPRSVSRITPAICIPYSRFTPAIRIPSSRITPVICIPSSRITPAIRIPSPSSRFTRAGNLFIRSSLICSFAHLLISLKSNEQQWAICSDCSRQMSNHERISQVAQRKWAIMSDLLRPLRGNERCEWIAHVAHKKWANEWFPQKMLAKKI